MAISQPSHATGERLSPILPAQKAGSETFSRNCRESSRLDDRQPTWTWTWALPRIAAFASVSRTLPDFSHAPVSREHRPTRCPQTPTTSISTRTPPTYQPLTPLQFLERAAAVYPDHTAVIHGTARASYAELYARCRRLASALAARGIGPGDTVSVMLSNTPSMLEAHYGVPMAGAVLHSLNTRLDAAIIAFQLDHADCQGADHRPRVRRDHEGGAGAGRA